MSGKGTLIIIGGHEDKEDDRTILTRVAKTAIGDKGRLVIVTVATQLPQEVAQEYQALFEELGVRNIDVLDIRTRGEARDDANVQKLANASTIFFTGGDQLRITSQIGDSPVFQCMREIYAHGGTIVGTSAGAAAMSETMLIGGPSNESSYLADIAMAPGLGFLSGVVIDSHFAERGRIGRLVGAVVQNPRNLGLGIDEDTAIIVEKETHLTVIGSGAVYVVDGTAISYSSLAERDTKNVLSSYGVMLHVLGNNHQFDLMHKKPILPKPLDSAST